MIRRPVVLTASLLALFPLRAQLTGSVSADSLGFSFTIPDGWQGGEQDGTWGMVSTEVPGTVMITTHEHRTLEALEQDMSKVDDQDPANRIARTGGPSHPLPNAVVMDFSGTLEWQPVQLCGIGLISDAGGPGLSIVAIAPGTRMDTALHRAALQVMRSVRFRRPVMPPVVAQWRTRLTGTRLTSLSSYGSAPSVEGSLGGGRSEQRTLDLCNEGRFHLRMASDVVIGGADATAAGSSANTVDGNWEVLANGTQGARLVLRAGDGSEEGFVLEDRDGATFLNGERWFRTTAADGDHAPRCDR